MDTFRRVWLPAILMLQTAALAGLGWLVWDTRVIAKRVMLSQPDPFYQDEPAWVARLDRSIGEVGKDAAQAARSAESAEKAAVRACRELGNYNC